LANQQGGTVDNDTLMTLKQGIESAWENESKELRDAFDEIDVDASGFIDRSEIGELAKKMGR
jgi:Ca2+-binding EF-hand superfamily protein